MATLTKKDYKFFDMARKVAQTSDFDIFHIGAVIVYKGHVVASAANSNKTHPAQAKYNRQRKFKKSKSPVKHSLHAEIAALESIPYPIAQQINWREVKVYIYRICPGKRLGQGIARCCPACMKALRDKGVQHLYYTTDEGYVYERLY